MNLLITRSYQSNTTVLQWGCLWHYITQKVWYAIKQRNQTKYKTGVINIFNILLSHHIEFTGIMDVGLSAKNLSNEQRSSFSEKQTSQIKAINQVSCIGVL